MELTKQNITLKRNALTAQIKAVQQELAELDQLEALAAKHFPGDPGQPISLFSAVPVALGVGTTKKARILDTSEQILATSKRKTSRELIAELAAKGVEVGGADPINNLGAYLSPEKKRFSYDRKKGGWGLAPQKKASPNDAPTSKGLISNGSAEGHHIAG